MSDELKEIPSVNITDKLTPSDEFYNSEFDGVVSDEVRSVVVDQKREADFGLPLNIHSIKSRESNEFEANGELTRNIATLQLSTDQLDALKSTEFESGACFQANGAIFAPVNTAVEHSGDQVAPPLPFFLQPAHTSFRTTKNLSKLRTDLETALSECSISFAVFDDACGYSCSALHQLSVIEIEIKIYDAENELLVEIRHTSGCRYAFGEVSELLAVNLDVTFYAPVSAPFCPPPLPDDIVDLPELKRTTSCEIRCNEEVATCEYAKELLAQNAPRATLVQGLRATGILVEKLTNAMNSCPHCGSCGAHHFSHEKLFAKNGPWVPLAERIGELASSDDEEIRTVAMAAVANIATLKHVCRKWLEGTIPTLVAGVGDELPHVRREALRSIEAVVTRDEKLAAKVIRAGAIPSLELEANGGEEDQSPDSAMRAYAEGALEACRSEK